MKKKDLVNIYSYFEEEKMPQLSISDSFLVYLIKRKGLSELEATDVVDKNYDRLKKIIKDDIVSHQKTYTYSTYIFSDYDKDILIRSDKLSNFEEPKSAYSRIEWWKKIRSAIQNLTWLEFENLAKYILKENGIVDICITDSTNDQGIDFYGFFKFQTGDFKKRFHKELVFRILGQVKFSNSNNGVSHQKVSSFATEIKKLRGGIGRSYFKGLSDEFLSSPHPVVGIFIANSYYPPKARNFANEFGIIIWDGTQISQDLSSNLFISKVSSDGMIDLNKFRSLIMDELDSFE